MKRQDVYSRRKNLRFFNIPETTDTTEENAKELIYRFMERELEVENARDIEFQRVHRIGARSQILLDQLLPASFDFPIEKRYLNEHVIGVEG